MKRLTVMLVVAALAWPALGTGAKPQPPAHDTSSGPQIMMGEQFPMTEGQVVPATKVGDSIRPLATRGYPVPLYDSIIDSALFLYDDPFEGLLTAVADPVSRDPNITNALDQIDFIIGLGAGATTDLTSIDWTFELRGDGYPTDPNVASYGSWSGTISTPITPGGSRLITISGLESQGILLPENFVIVLTLENPVGGDGFHGAYIGGPADPGDSLDQVFGEKAIDGTWVEIPGPGGVTWGNLAVTLSYNDPTREVAYDNTVNDGIYALGTDGIDWFLGDDINLAASGTLDIVEFGIWNDSASTAALESCTLTLEFYDTKGTLFDTADDVLVDDLAIDIDFNALGSTLDVGFATTLVVTDLLADPNAPVLNEGTEYIVKSVYSNVVPTTGIAAIGSLNMGPAVVGSTRDLFIEFAPTTVNYWWYGGNPFSSMYFKFVMGDVIQPTEGKIYQNSRFLLDGSTRDANAVYETGTDPVVWGDDMTITRGGKLESLVVYIWNADPSTDPNDPNAPPLCAGITSVDLAIEFEDLITGDPIGSFTHSADLAAWLGDPNGLEGGFYTWYTISGLDTLPTPVVFDERDVLVKISYQNQVGGCAGAMGTVMYDPAVIGRSRDLVYEFDGVDPNTEGFYTFGGDPVASYGLEMRAVEWTPLPLEVYSIPELEQLGAITYQTSVTDLNAVGGVGVDLTTDVQDSLLYDFGTDTTLTFVSAPAGVPAGTDQLGWLVYGPTTGQVARELSNAVTITPADEEEAYALFSSFMDITALVDGSDPGLAFTLTELDLNGAGDGTTPANREFGPIDEVDPYPIKQIGIGMPDPTTVGKDKILFTATLHDGTISTLEDTEAPWEVFLAPAFFKEVVAEYQSDGLCGDMNCDGIVDVFDINPFVQAILDPAGYAAAFPACDINNGDINLDSAVDVFDINPFVDEILNGTGCVW